MPIFLALETSSELASVALSWNGEIISRECAGAQTHSQTVLPMACALLAEAGVQISGCDAIAFGSGPGSFTGVRTACGLAQGLAFGADLPVIPVITLEAMAHGCFNLLKAHHVLPILDARMGEVYWAHYRFEGECETLHGPSLSSPAAVPIEGNPVICGNGIIAYQGSFQRTLSNVVIEESILTPHASHILALAELKFRQGLAVSAQEAQPFYLRNKIAFTSAERAAKLSA